MNTNKAIQNHYSHGKLLQAIEAALPHLGKTPETLTIEDLAPMDEFHIGGRQATEHLFKQLRFSEQDHLLDVGCGIGGTARYVHNLCHSRITGIDLTEEFVVTGETLCAWLNMDSKIRLHVGSALATPFKDASFDGAYMLHVGMNIADKATLFKEIRRLLRPGSNFGVYDVMRHAAGELSYPVPWATDSSTSSLGTIEDYTEALEKAGFDIEIVNNRQEFALQFFEKLRAQPATKNSPPPLSLHTIMQTTTAHKVNNMIENITSGLVAPVEIIAVLR
ncbi:class I SAM-dependent methyltransferase [Coraliomargarita parva]|uniref:class I SAM-dependent methyltransferase n=1 Tax=Coraliomargarita parva TaxID=3014050 RepID=UPI0022B429BF|nr:class I SAM-dependent methyltransferase [Coraliomargarita parva]